MAALNKCQFIGNCGTDVDVRDVNGVKSASFRLAITERYKDRNGEKKEATEWVNIACWRGAAEIAAKYVKKGDPIYIEGKYHTREYTDRNGEKRYITEVVVETIQLLGRKPDNQTSDTAF